MTAKADLGGDRSAFAVVKARLPLSVRLRNRDLVARVGTMYPWPTGARINTGVRLHFGWDKDSELPGLHLWLDITLLHVYLHIGAGWTDEDGEHRTFLSGGAYLKTYGLRYVGCWLGHEPEREDYPGRYFVTCSRCDAQLEQGETTTNAEQSSPTSSLDGDLA